MKNFIIYIVLVSFFFFLFPIFLSASAASLQLDPVTVSTPSGETFEIKVNVDAGTDNVKSADAWISYDPTVLQAETVTDGTFFSAVNKDLSTSGKAYVSGMVDDPTKPVTGKGTIATITFKALTDGTDTLKFDCVAGSTNATSFIIKADSADTNVMVCTENGTSAITVGSGVNTTPTVEPSGEPTPSILPKSGIFDNVVKFAVPGTALLLIGLALKLL